MIAPFLHRTPASRLVFGPGAVGTLRAELAALGVRRPLVLSGPRTAASPLHAAVRSALGDSGWVGHDRVPAHSSVATVQALVDLARREGVDGFVVVGGGSASDTAKAVSLLLAEGGWLEDHATRFTPPDRLVMPELRQPKLALVAVPGTASAAEVTPGLGVRTDDGRKLLFTDLQLAARVILIDPALNVAVPAALMLSTGMNGLAHCIEGLYSRVRSPASTALALHGAAQFLRALPAVAARPHDVDARGALLVAAQLSGQVLLNARTCLHHAICHALGASTGIGHGDANAVLLPEAVAFNAPACAAELAAAARACELPAATPDALVERLRSLQHELGVPTRLRDLGVRHDQLAAVAGQVMHERGLYFNPRTVQGPDEIAALLDRVW